ncbi:MAG TPA: aminoacyl--tRNA ligase-related protein, partial [Actinomycetota bacterium]|nr:aminoacyl--tRNA ligase-related protein [Actinomycetota bacterium]
MRHRGADIDLDALIELDREHRRLVTEVDNLRADLNRAQKAIGKLSPEERPAAIARNKLAGTELKELEAQMAKAAQDLEAALLMVPNLVHPDSPPGREDVELRKVGSPRAMDFPPADHLTLGEGLGIIDVKRAAKVSGSRFAILRGKGALLELALVRFVLDRLMGIGFEPVIPPVLVREEAMYGTGFFPTDEAQVYKTAEDELYLAGTSEVPIAGMHANEIFAAKELPVRYAGISTCFRREAGTYGKDTRGIIRVHQFDKVEMFSFCR